MPVEFVPQSTPFPPPRVWRAEECEPFETAFNPARVTKVVDADTLDLAIDLGRDVKGFTARIRLTHEGWLKTNRKIGFNAWETRGKEKPRGDVAKKRASDLCPYGSVVRTRSWKGGTRGSLYRWVDLVLVRCVVADGDLVFVPEFAEEPMARWYSLADILLHEGHGREWWKGWKRGAPRPVV